MRELNDRIGEKRVMTCGLEATIIAYKHYNNIDVRFSNGFISRNKTYGSFVKGHIECKGLTSKRLGEKRVMNCGLEATIITYRSSMDIDVRFSNGFIARNKTYHNFHRGSIGCEDRDLSSKYLGETRVMSCGLDATIITYRNNRNIDVRFSDGSIVRNKHYGNFTRGHVSHPTLRFNGSVVKGSTLSTFSVEKLSYRLKDPRDVLYVCECQKCHLRDILTPREMLDHTC